MAGGAIVAVTLIVIGLAVFLIWLSFRVYAGLDQFLHAPERGLAAKLLLAIPFLIVGIWCFLLQIFLVIITLGAAASALGGVRDWWHKGN